MGIKYIFYKLGLILSFLVSLVLMLVVPSEYNYTYTLWCMILFFISVLFYYLSKPRTNYFDFDTLFITAYFFVFFSYPVFLYPIDPYYFDFFSFDFNQDVISKATIIALVGIQAYFIGAVTYKERIDESDSNSRVLSVSGLTKYSVIGFFLFLLAGGWEYFLTQYGSYDNNPMLNYLFLFYFSLLVVALIIEMNNIFIDKKTHNLLSIVKRPVIIFSIVILYLYLFLGSRTAPMQLILIIIGYFSYRYKPIGLLQFGFFAFIGVLLMFLIMLHRAGTSASLTNSGIFDITMDLIINNRNSFVAIDYVEENGFTYGLNMLGSLSSFVPFLQKFIVTLFGINPVYISSSMLITYVTLGEEPSGFGLGTNIIADLYLSFGTPGVIFFMFVLGYFVSKVRNLAKNNIYYMYSYLIMMSYSVFSVRAEFFIFMRLLIWGILIIYIVKLFDDVREYENKYN